MLAMATAILEAKHAMRRSEAPAPAIWPVSSPAPAVERDSLAVLTERVADADVFRLDRTPATVAYRQAADTQVARVNVPPAPPKPALALAGIIGGPPWAALLDGVPGHPGSLVVHRGDSLAGLTVRAISPNGATVTGMDTTWRLVVKRPWP
jgi:hypothetical protein